MSAQLRRDVLVEAGDRCAIPTCRRHPVDIEHIDDWAKVKEHKFENLIALCPTCHRRKGNGPDQIDRQSLKQYKKNLTVLNSRYGEVKRRLIEVYAEQLARGWSGAQEGHRFSVPLGFGAWWQVMYLVRDGYLKKATPRRLAWPSAECRWWIITSSPRRGPSS
jgi:hypothetical protein